MNTPVSEVLEKMFTMHGASGQLDLDQLLSEFPEHAELILDMALELDMHGSRMYQPELDRVWEDVGDVAGLVRRHEEQLTRDPVPAGRDVQALGRDLSRARKSRRDNPPQWKGNVNFQRSAVYTWALNEVSEGGTVERYTVGKVVYFLERTLGLGLFTLHKRMTYGPYDPSTKYRDAEPIAEKQGWLVRGPGSSLSAGNNIDEGVSRGRTYLGREDLARRLTELIEPLGFEHLELLATVDWVVNKELEPGQISPQKVRETLYQIPEWKGKLSRGLFDQVHISKALEFLSELGLVESEDSEA